MKPGHHEDGFTLPELMMSTLVFVVLMAVVLTAMEVGTQVDVAQQSRAHTLQGLRETLRATAREIREGEAVTTATETELEIWGLDEKRVQYRITDGQLQRAEGEGHLWTTLMDGLSVGSTFAYDNGMVVVTLASRPKGSSAAVALSAEVRLRNLVPT